MAGILTAAGEAKVALSIGGTAIAFAALRIGDGNGAPIVPNRLMTDLVRRVGGAYPVIASARDPENPTHWRVTTEIPAGEGPFTCREIAVFDAVGDMIAIAAHPTVEFTGPGGDQLSIITDIVFPVSGAANVAVTISPTAQVPITRNLRPFWLAVESASVTVPPANPAVGASYIIPAGAAGAWEGQAGSIAQFTGEDWAITAVPVGHLACMIDKPLDAAGRYLRRTADAWVPAEATDVAIGFARRATAAEIAAGNGNGFVTPGQMLGAIDGLNDWDNIGNKPATFPPSPHDHDDRYFTETETAALLAGKSNNDHLHDDRYYTEAESDGRFVAQAGDTMSGPLYLNNGVGVVFKNGSGDYAFGTAGGIINAAGDGTLYLQNFQNSTRITRNGGNTTAEFKQDSSTAFYGPVSVTALSATGAVNAATITATTTTGNGAININASGIGSVWSMLMGGSYQFELVRQGVGLAFSIGNYGEIGLGAAQDFGAAGKVLASNGAGSAASWKTLAELGIGARVIAAASGTVAHGGSSTTVAAQIGCAVTRVADIGADTIIRCTFSTARASATYDAHCVCNGTSIGTVVAATTTYVEFNLGPDADTGGPAPQRYLITIYEG